MTSHSGAVFPSHHSVPFTLWPHPILAIQKGPKSSNVSIKPFHTSENSLKREIYPPSHSSSPRQCVIQLLPDDAMLHILSFLGIRSIASSSIVCKSWACLAPIAVERRCKRYSNSMLDESFLNIRTFLRLQRVFHSFSPPSPNGNSILNSDIYSNLEPVDDADALESDFIQQSLPPKPSFSSPTLRLLPWDDVPQDHYPSSASSFYSPYPSSSPVTSLASHSSLLLAAKEDGQLRLWSLDSSVFPLSISTLASSDSDSITCCKFMAYDETSANPTHILTSGHHKGFVCLRDIQTMQQIHRFQPHSTRVNCLDSRDNVLLTASKDGTIKMIDIRTSQKFSSEWICTPIESIGQNLYEEGLGPHSDSTFIKRCSARSSTPFLTVSAGTDGVVHLWDLRSCGTSVSTLPGLGASLFPHTLSVVDNFPSSLPSSSPATPFPSIWVRSNNLCGIRKFNFTQHLKEQRVQASSAASPSSLFEQRMMQPHGARTIAYSDRVRSQPAPPMDHEIEVTSPIRQLSILNDDCVVDVFCALSDGRLVCSRQENGASTRWHNVLSVRDATKWKPFVASSTCLLSSSSFVAVANTNGEVARVDFA